jgi:ribosomal protein S18 acetylase RimI-like enzyme
MTGPHYTWHDAMPSDLDGLKALEDACSQADGPELIAWGNYRAMIESPDGVVTCAKTPDGQLAAVAWAKLGSSPAMLGGKVHPDHRRKGLGSEVIRQAEEAARRRGERQVFIRNEAVTDGALALYERQGYAVDFVEYWMNRDLSAPLSGLAPEIRLETWTDANALFFYETFIESFKDRGGPQRESAEVWISGYEEDEDFRADLCLLAWLDDTPVAFVTAGPLHPPRYDAPIGWISQTGVRPPWRGRSIVDGLIGEVGRRVHREGIRTLGLDVNLNNPRAIRVYERNGFAIVGRRAKFSKILE